MNNSLFPLYDHTFKNIFVENFTGDKIIENYSRSVADAFYSWCLPTPVQNPSLIGWSEQLGELLCIQKPDHRKDYSLDILAGNLIPKSMKPYALRYGGHQFGSWAGQLGDGRVINLGNVEGIDGKSYEVQLKGAGPTPYSRRSDGRAVLRSSIREFLCSEAMFYLGVPSTRALSLIITGESVIRDMFYDGNPKAEPGAIVCRIAESFLRFGNFEILAYHNEKDNLRNLIEYTINNYFKETKQFDEDVYIEWFYSVCTSTAKMIAHWMSLGFVHGVMNTDNMSILGVTIDYGPYGWMESYEPSWTPNTTDFNYRRYTFENQQKIGMWNLSKLAEALSIIAPNTKKLITGLDIYNSTFEKTYYSIMYRKLGLYNNGQSLSSISENFNINLLNKLKSLFENLELDMTIFHRRLSDIASLSDNLILEEKEYEKIMHILTECSYKSELSTLEKENAFEWIKMYLYEVNQTKLKYKITKEELKIKMDTVNPKYILRNYLMYQANVDAEQGNYTLFDNLSMIIKNPFSENPSLEYLANKRPDWAKYKFSCSTLSCSS